MILYYKVFLLLNIDNFVACILAFLYFCNRQELFDKQTYAHCRN